MRGARKSGVRALDKKDRPGISPDDARLEGETKAKAPYEGGTAMASLAREKTEPSLLSSIASIEKYEAQPPSVHVNPTTDDEAIGPQSLRTEPLQPGEVSGCRRPSGEKSLRQAVFHGLPLGWCGTDLFQCLLEVLPLRSQDTGKRTSSDIFPLPTSRSCLLDHAPGITGFEVFWCLCVCICLNSLWGAEVRTSGPMNEGQRSCVDEILKDLKRFVGIHEEVKAVDWSCFFNVRSIDYKGDEVRVAKWFSWKNIGPALPADVGVVPLDEICTHGCRDYVLNFDHYLKPRSEWEKLTSPKVMVKDEDWAEVCRGLLASGVCVAIAEEEVFQTDSGPLLNGLFGVSKDEVSAQGFDIFRLIMNLVPLNKLCKPIAGDVDSLPSWSGMSPFFLQPNEQLLISSEDVKCFFYTMSVPSCWVKYLAFNKLIADSELPPGMKGTRAYLASRVLPMGFLNSVSLAQHVHRNLVNWSRASELGNPEELNQPQAELRKDREFSSHNPLWRVYLDNYDLLERVEASEVVGLEGTQAAGVLSLRQQYEKWGVPRNLKKAVERSSRCELQGATVDGVAGVAFPRESKLVKYFSMSLDLCYAPLATQRQWQVVCGGLVYISMFRRPLLGSLN